MRTRVLLAAAIASTALGFAVDGQAAVHASVAHGKLTVTGGNAGERIALRASSGGRLVVDVGDNGSANFVFSRSAFRRIVVNGGGGNDRLRIDESNGAFTKAEKTTFNGGAGNDRLTGGRYAETLTGGSGNDVANGSGGADRVRGNSGLDTVTVDRSSGANTTTVAPGSVPGHVKVGGGPDLLGVETLNVNPLAGADTTTVANVPGTGLTTINIGLGVSGVGDLSVDAVTVTGSAGVDVFQAAAVSGAVQVTGLAAQVNVALSEPATDTLTLGGLGGNDTISGSVGLAALVKLIADGGDGNDTLNGGNGADTLLGGIGNDTVDGNGGNDTAFLGAGNDTFVWDPGDGSDVVEGQSDTDSLLFNGSAGAEIFAASSNGGRLLFTRNVGNIVMDTDDVELLTVNALGSIDTLTVNDLAATDITAVNLNLGVSGASDGANDAVTVNGTVGVDLMNVSGSAGSVSVTTTAYPVSLTNAAPANDTLTFNLSGGDDLFSASGLAATSVDLTINGGSDDDVLVASQGGDTINCDAGADYADGGAGIDAQTGCETVVNVP
jgi:Ca2+-binding RTX toxin-like protein